MKGLRICCYFYIFAIILFLSGCQSDFAVRNPPEEITVLDSQLSTALTIEEICDNNADGVQIIRSPETNLVSEIRGSFSKHMIFSETDALIALGSVRNIMNISDFSFCCSMIDKRTDSVVFSLAQVYKGVPVIGYGFRVGASNDGTPLFVSGSFREDINTSVNPVINVNECVKFLSLSNNEEISEAELVIYANSDGEFLCWKYDITSDDPLRCRTICCDATTGKIITTLLNAVA